MISIFICDDEPFWISRIETMIENYQMKSDWDITLAYKATSPEQLLDYLQLNKPINGLYFLDIHFPSGMSGLELAATIRQLDPRASLIFITTKEELAAETFRLKLEALDFITKDTSVLDREVHDCLTYLERRFLEASNPNMDMITFHLSNRQKTFPLQDIYCLSTANGSHRVSVYTRDEVLSIYSTLRSIQEQLNEDFQKCGRDCIINMRHIKEWNASTRTITLNNEMTCECSVREWRNLAKFRKE